jgi:hypothetical protein
MFDLIPEHILKLSKKKYFTDKINFPNILIGQKNFPGLETHHHRIYSTDQKISLPDTKFKNFKVACFKIYLK